jgi:hypothetical protein
MNIKNRKILFFIKILKAWGFPMICFYITYLPIMKTFALFNIPYTIGYIIYFLLTIIIFYTFEEKVKKWVNIIVFPLLLYIPFIICFYIVLNILNLQFYLDALGIGFFIIPLFWISILCIIYLYLLTLKNKLKYIIFTILGTNIIQIFILFILIFNLIKRSM